MLDTAASKSTKLGIGLTGSFTDQVEANKASNSSSTRGGANTGRGTITRSDLDQVRPILDRITDQLLAPQRGRFGRGARVIN